jgi:hypothetical protein
MSIAKYFPGLRFVEPTSDSDPNGPHIVNAHGEVVAKLFWPCHTLAETAEAEDSTYALGRAMAAVGEFKQLEDRVDLLRMTNHDLVQACEQKDATIAELNGELERERMRLAGCGVAAMLNTTDSLLSRIPTDSPYWSASYGGVCAAVDREMQLRDELA